MHVSELVELGALVAAHGGDFVQNAALLSRLPTEQYWLASRYRYDRWFQVLKTHERSLSVGKQEPHASIQGTMEEVLAGELLTRTWAAVGCSFDRQHATTCFEPVVRRVLVDHMEARNRVLHGLLQRPTHSSRETARLNRLRRQTERWTDMMLGHLGCHFDVAEFAFNPDRVCEFSNDLRDEARASGHAATWNLTLASLRRTYQECLVAPSPHPDLNHAIAASVLACFDGDPLNCIETSKLPWTLRLSQLIENAQQLLKELLRVDDTAEDSVTFR